MIPHPSEPLAASAYSLLNVMDFLCLGAGVYLLLVLHDRHRHGGYLLTALGLGVMALRLVPDQLFAGQPGLQEAALTLATALAVVMVSWGTLALTGSRPKRSEGTPAARTLLLSAGGIAALAVVLVWIVALWSPLRDALSGNSSGGAFWLVEHRLRVAAAAALVTCAWITWERRTLGPELSRMFGFAYLAWAGSLLLGVVPFSPPASGLWLSQTMRVLGSLFLANALALNAYREEVTALERQRRLQLLDRVASAAIAAPRLQPMIESATDEVRALLGAEWAATYLLADTGERLFAAHRTSERDLPPRSLLLDRDRDHPIAAAFASRAAVRFDGLSGKPGDRGNAIAVPLMSISQPVGVLAVSLPRPGQVTDTQAETLLNAGAQLGIIVQHMLLLEEVRQARDRWRQTFDAIAELVTVHDRDGRITAANAAAQTFAGMSEEQLIGRTLRGALPDVTQEQEEMVRSCCATGSSPGTRMLRARGRVHQVQVMPLRDDLARGLGCVRVARDVTSRWRAEERLAQSERRYRELAENANDIIYTHDLEGKFLYVNQAAVRQLGYSREEFSHLRFWDVVAPASLPQARSYVRGLLEGTPQDEQVQLRLTCADGRVAVVELRANVLRRAGHSEAIHGIARDVTAEEQLATQLMQADRLASVGTLIAGIAHELNNPLTTISGYAHLLSDALDGSVHSSMIATLEVEAERCRHVARSLLSFARQTDERRLAFDVNEALRGVIDLRAYDLREAGIALVADFDEHLPQVLADYGQLQQVFYNLLDNAYYALAEQGGGEIRVRTGAADGQVQIEVADDGPGVPPELRARLFEPFVTSKPRGEGTGLGLSICRRIIEEHGGTISLEVDGRPGARFLIALPACAATEVRHQVPPALDPTSTTERARSLRVLFIEDEAPLCALVDEYLTRLGHRVTTAASGEEGVTSALAGDFDVIVCDMRLPGITGEEVCERLLAHDPSFAGRLLIATGDILSPQTRAFFDRTCLPHIQKPFRLQQLAALIADLAAGRPVSEHVK